jgi:hypothetical protein
MVTRANRSSSGRCPGPGHFLIRGSGRLRHRLTPVLKTGIPENGRSSTAVMGWFPPVEVDLQLIILDGRLVVADRSCNAFDPVHAYAEFCVTGI